MRLKVLLVLVVVLALVPVAGSASAAGKKKAPVLKAHVLLKESASYLGVTVKQLRVQLKAGQSLAQIADATAGKSSSSLLDDLVGVVKTKLDQRVAAGKLKSDRESKLLARATKRLQHRLAHVKK